MVAGSSGPARVGPTQPVSSAGNNGRMHNDGYNPAGEAWTIPWMSGQFKRSLKLDPWSLPAQAGMSIVLLQGDRTEEAFRLARQVAEREPKDATALFVAGIAAGRLRRRDEALTLIRQTVAIEPDNAQFQVALRHLERTVVKP